MGPMGGMGGGGRGGGIGGGGRRRIDGQVNDIKHLTLRDLMIVLSPFFWPSKGSDGAFINRIRSTLTWVCVALSKISSLVAPLYISAGANALVNGQSYSVAAYNIGCFCALRFASVFFKESQGLVFLKVKQQAYIQLAEQTFEHLHELSLNWHLTKKTGNVIRSMDRGTEAASQLVSNIFLFLGPAIIECFAVCIIFFTHFNSMALGGLVLSSVALYIITTVAITMWRRKFREATNKHDNDFHEKATDSIINFETVKYFTAEKFEVDRFAKAVSSFQKFMISTQASGSLLNIMQAFILNGATLGALLLAGWEVQRGNMEIGGFVAVQAYINSMFAPLNFLGFVYQGIIQGMIDVKNLCDLLSQEPDVTDMPGAKAIPILRVWTHNRRARAEGKSLLRQRRCASVGCGEYLRPEWRFCANCGSPDIDADLFGIGEEEEDEGEGAGRDGSASRSKRRMFAGLGSSGKLKAGNSRHGLLEDEDASMELSTARGYQKVRKESSNPDTSPVDSVGDIELGDLVGGVDVDFSGVYFHYLEQPPEKGLKDVSFHVPAGTSLAVVGHTGAGKTTISRLLFRFYDPLQGEVSIGGYNIKRYTQKSVRQCIGIVPQDTVLFNDTILHNIKYGNMDATMEEVESAADAAQIRTFVESLPEKWETVVGERGLKLSGGEKQRVAIARCLLKDPPIVCLDEATSALDTATEQSVQNALEALGRKRTVIVIAHRLSTVCNCDQIVVMDAGRIAERGTHDSLLAQKGIYHNLWSMQLKNRDDEMEQILLSDELTGEKQVAEEKAHSQQMPPAAVAVAAASSSVASMPMPTVDGTTFDAQAAFTAPKIPPKQHQTVPFDVFSSSERKL